MVHWNRFFESIVLFSSKPYNSSEKEENDEKVIKTMKNEKSVATSEKVDSA
jgi:hypothetical protein